MTPDAITLAVIDALEAAGLRYVIVGSLSSNFHGIPRATQDADDVRNILAIRGDTLDWDYVRRWTAAHGSSALLDEIRQSIPPER